MGSVKTPQPLSFDLGETVDLLLDEYRYGSSPRTLEFYEYNLKKKFLPFFQSQDITRLEDVTPTAIRRYLVHQRQTGIAGKSLEQRYDTARRFFNWCVEQLLLDESPMKGMRRPKVEKRVRYAFDRKEIKQLLNAAKSKIGAIGFRDRAILAVLLSTGARSGELLGMRLGDIDWTKNRILVHGKGGRDRRVPLGRPAALALREWLKYRFPVEDDHVWITIRRRPLEADGLWVMLSNLGKAAGVENVHPHRFRHTAATELMRETRNILLVKAYLGHSKVETTTRYLESLGAEYEEAGYASPDTWLLTTT